VKIKQAKYAKRSNRRWSSNLVIFIVNLIERWHHPKEKGKKIRKKKNEILHNNYKKKKSLKITQIIKINYLTRSQHQI
jgi:hypothetical protein